MINDFSEPTQPRCWIGLAKVLGTSSRFACADACGGAPPQARAPLSVVLHRDAADLEVVRGAELVCRGGRELAQLVAGGRAARTR
jgi:hypothetical protein